MFGHTCREAACSHNASDLEGPTEILAARLLIRFRSRGPLSLAEAFSPELRTALPPAHWAAYLRSISTTLVDTTDPTKADLSICDNNTAYLQVAVPDRKLLIEIRLGQSWIDGIYTIRVEEAHQ